MDYPTSDGYNKRPLWQWILLYAAIGAVVYGVIYYFIMAGGKGGYSTNTSQPSTATQPSAVAEGRVVVALKDAVTTGLNGVTAIVVTVDKVDVHSAAKGWVTVAAVAKQYDLLLLKQSGAAALLADANLAADTYDQIRLNISRVDVTANGTTKQAKLPSSSLKIVGDLTVREGQTSSAIIDILADKSLHLTGSGKYILAPVAKLEIKNDTIVEIATDGVVTLNGGKIETNKIVGMSADGETKDNFELQGDLEVDTEDRISLDGKVITPKNIEAEDSESSEYNKADEQGRENTSDQGNENSSVVLNFTPDNNSGLSGTAKVEEDGDKVKVKIELRGGVSDLLASSKPAHIHLGSCPTVGGVKYALNPVVDGESETTVNTTLAELKAGLPLAINVHKSAEEIETYVACADLKF
ncbi:MAG: DUF4382 domain-containing protein [Patescibacteria group bacterium]|jgi:hypothetical protein